MARFRLRPRSPAGSSTTMLISRPPIERGCTQNNDRTLPKTGGVPALPGTSLLLPPVQHLPHLDRQVGGGEWLLQEILFRRDDAVAEHGVVRVAAQVEHA